MDKAKIITFGGWLLITAGVGLGAGYWLVIVPLAQSIDPALCPGRSLAGFWDRKQLCLKLGITHHDDGWFIGKFGNKQWASWVLNKLKPGNGIGCSGGHKEVAFRYLTNQDFRGADDEVRSLEAWWESHKSQSQEEWIQQGFAKTGIQVSLPPSTNDWPNLLHVLGRKSLNDKNPDSEPKAHFEEHFRYNAFRCLRDSGFDPVDYLLTEPHKVVAEDAIEGIRAYRSYEKEFTTPAPGKLAFADEDKASGYFRQFQPRGLDLRFKLGASIAAILITAVGITLIQLRDRVSRFLTDKSGTPSV